jgi:hypothetical protein
MKKIFYLLVATLLIFSSCKKDNELNLYGTWVLVDGTLYTDNMETHEQIKYQHFGLGKTRSQLTGFTKATFPIEFLIKDTTTWEFKRNGDFILNNNIDSPMYCNMTASNMTIIEHPASGISMLGGSARPIHAYTYDYEKKIIVVFIQDQIGSKDGYNIEWNNKLFFRKVKDE